MNEEMSQLVERLNVAQDEDQKAVFEEAIEELESTELSLLLESLPLDKRLQRWDQIPAEERVDVLVSMRADPRETIIESIGEEELQLLLSGLHAEDLIELAESLPESLVDSALAGMDANQRTFYEQSAQYQENQIGRFVDHSLLILPKTARVREALRVVKKQLPEYTDSIFLVQRNGTYAGAVPLHRLFSAGELVPLGELATEDPTTLYADMSLVDATEKMEHSGATSLPVLDENKFLLGRLTLRLALEITREQYESQLMATAGMHEDEDLFAPVLRSSQRRATWLGINLVTAFLASWAIGQFEATLREVVALAVLMPIVASMGGIAGSQTLTLIIRGIAVGQITNGNTMPLLMKEIGVGVLNGALWALVIGAVSAAWFANAGIGMVIAAAIVINILAAAFSGVVIPLMLDRYHLDPALSGSVILTTVTDVVGFVAFLGLGTLFLLT